MIGRERELEQLVELACAPPALAVVRGEAGVGKTRLVSELVDDQRLARRRVLVGRCHDLCEPFPLGALIEALRTAFSEPPAVAPSAITGALRPLLPEVADRLPPRPLPLDDPRAERHRIFRALRELLGCLGPTVCVLEDLHWSDEGTLEFLAYLVAEWPAGLSLVLTCRGDEPRRRASVAALGGRASPAVAKLVVELPALGVLDVLAMATSMIGDKTVSERFAAWLHARTGGLPFAVEEMLALVLANGGAALARDGGPDGALERLGIPVALRELVLQRAKPLSPAAGGVVRALAVLRRPSGEELVRSVASLSAVRAGRAFDEALGSTLIQEREGVYCFRHDLAAQAVLEQIGAAERRRLHLRAAHALERLPEPRPLGPIADHFQQARRRGQWLRYAEAAADAARASGADRDAVRILERAVSEPDLPLATRARMAIKLGDAALYGAASKAAIGLLDEVLREPSLPVGVRGELRFSLCRLRLHAGDTERWPAEMLRAVDELRRRPGLRARAMVNLAMPRLMGGEMTDHLAWLDRAERVATARDDGPARIAVAAQRAVILLSTGDPGGWRVAGDLPSSATDLDEQLQILRGLHNLALTALDLGELRRAETFLADAERIQAGVSHASWDLWLDSARIVLDGVLGRWQGLEARARRVLQTTADTPVMCFRIQSVVGGLLQARGLPGEAEGSFREALGSARASQAISGVVEASTGLARVRLARGDRAGAVRLAAGALDAVERKGIWPLAAHAIPVAIDGLLAGGDRASAQTLLATVRRGLHGRHAPGARAALALGRGALAEAIDPRHAARWFACAQNLWEEVGDPYRAAQARERRGRCLLVLGEAGGRDALLGAHASFAELGAGSDAARVRVELRRHGIPLPYPWRGGRRGYGRELSPQEAQVARLAGAGRTNREIAEALFISRRTAEGHVSAVLRKLGARSRVELASRALPEPKTSTPTGR